MADRGGAPVGFTREARRRLNAIRAATYTLAFLFMFAMGIQGVWVTRGQMEAEAERSILSTEIAVAGLVETTGRIDAARIEALLSAPTAKGVSFGIADRNGQAVAGLRSLPPDVRTLFRRADVGEDGTELRAAIDRDVIWRAALRANVASILFILALGIPTLLSFFYLRRMVNRPAFALLDYAQAEQSNQPPPDMPAIWTPVMERLTQLKNTQAQLQAFLDHAPIGMSAFKPNGPYVLVNRYGADYYDRSVEDLVGKMPADFAHYYPDNDRLRSLFVEPVEHGRTAMVESEFLAPTGEVRTLLITTFPIFGIDGRVDLVGTYFVDLTHQRRAEIDLEESRALFEAFIRNAPDPMALIDAKGQKMRYVMLNDATARYYDMTPQALLASGYKHIHSRFLEAKTVIAPMLGRVMRTLEGEQVDTLFETPSGDIRDMAFAFFPILDRDGELAFVGNISHDMTDERRTQAELAQSKDSLHQAEKLAALGSMLAGSATS